MRTGTFIGIDPGVKTGFAVIQDGLLIDVACHPIHKAMKLTRGFILRMPLIVYIEDARKRKWFGNAGVERLIGAGSIRRDCKIWEDFLTDCKIDFCLVPPKSNSTKLSHEAFCQITGWSGRRTNEHGRDAAMLVFRHLK